MDPEPGDSDFAANMKYVHILCMYGCMDVCIVLYWVLGIWDLGFGIELDGMYGSALYCTYVCNVYLPVVPHKTVAEVPKIGNL